MFADADGPEAPPRRNGELAFEEPWESRVFALAAAVIEKQFDGDREPFRQRLVAAIADSPERPYWESWTVALEALTVETGLLTSGSIDAAARTPGG
jgi:hypothetical protein